MNIQIGGGAKSLNEGDRTRGGVFALDAGLSDEEGSNDAVDDLQHGCEQCGMHESGGGTSHQAIKQGESDYG